MDGSWCWHWVAGGDDGTRYGLQASTAAPCCHTSWATAAGTDRLQRRRAALLAQQAVLSSYLHSPAALPPKERKYTELQLSQCRLRLNRCSPIQVLRANLKLAAATEQLRLLRQHLAAYEVGE